MKGNTMKKNTDIRSVANILRSFWAIYQISLNVFMLPYFPPGTALNSIRLITSPTTMTPASTISWNPVSPRVPSSVITFRKASLA